VTEQVGGPGTGAPGLDALDAGVLEAPDPDVKGVLAITPFRRLWLALGFSSFGDWLGLLAITAMADYLARGSTSGQYLAVAGVFILRLAPSVVLGPLAGALADRISRRWLLVYGDVLRFAILATVPFVGTLWWLYVATLLIECVGLFWLPAKDATMPNLVPRKRLEAANQLSLVATYGTAPIAALAFSGLVLLNGIVVHAFPGLGLDPKGSYLGIWIDSLSYLVSGLVIWRLDFPKSVTRIAAEQPLWRAIVEGWRFVGGTPLIRGLVVGMLGAFAAGGLVIGLGQQFAVDLGGGPAAYGVLFAAVFFGLAGGMWLGPRLLSGLSRRRLFGLSLTCAGLWLVLLSLVPNIVVATVLTIGLGACGGVAWVCGYTLLGLEVGDEVRGRTFSFVQSLVRVVLISVLALGPALAALLGRVFSLPRTLHLGDDIVLTYSSAMATFLLAGLFAIGVGIMSFRQIDDRRGISLWRDLVAALGRSGDLRVLSAPRREYPGFFVALEGGDGVGKSTQAEGLRTWLEGLGHEVVLTREPGGTPEGLQMREVLLHQSHLAPRAEALLFAADRAHHVATVVRPALARGAVVVTDRYVDSSVAYQGAGRELAAEEVAQLSDWATAGLKPDLTVVLDLAPDDARARVGASPDRLESEPDDFHNRVRERFLQLARSEPRRYLVVNAASLPEHIQDQVRERLASMLPETERQRAERERREAEVVARLAAEAAAEAQRAAEAEQAGRAEADRLAREQAARDAALQAQLQAQRAAELERAVREHRERQEALAAGPGQPTREVPVVPSGADVTQHIVVPDPAAAAVPAAAPTVPVDPAAAADPADPAAAPTVPVQESDPQLAEQIFSLGVEDEPSHRR
jgi:dTMP kinase